MTFASSLTRRLFGACPGLLLIAFTLDGQAAQDYPFTVQNIQGPDGYRIVAKNGGPAPVSVSIALSDGQNVSSDRGFPFQAVVAPNSGTVTLATVHAMTPGAAYSFRTRQTWLIGDYTAQPNPDALYRLPFADGQTFRIGQAPGGTITTHTTPDSKFAVDIPMPEGTTIVAARDGLVIETEASQVDAGPNPEPLAIANAIRIQHADGTIGVYAHLQHDGVLVQPGQQVTTGMPIGRAGSTGYSSGPHLHFAIQQVVRAGDGFTVMSLPFRFYVGNPPAAFTPQSAMNVKADYVGAAQAPAFDERQRVPTDQPASPTTGDDHADAQPALPPGKDHDRNAARQALRAIPSWKWIVAVAALPLLLTLFRSQRRARRLRAVDAFAPDFQHTVPAVARPASDRERLIVACGNDRDRAARLMEVEHRQAPTIDNVEAARRALVRLGMDA